MSTPTSEPERGVGSRIVTIVGVAAGIATVVGLVVGLLRPGSSSGSGSANPSASLAPISSTARANPSSNASATSMPTTGASAVAPPQIRYVSVPFGVLCNADGADTSGFNGLYGCQVDNGTAAIGSQVFSWAALSLATSDPTPAFSFPKTTCRRITLNFGFSHDKNSGAGPGLEITVSVLQNGTGPHQTRVAYDQLGSLTVKLNGGPWDIETTANIPGGPWDLYVNGFASCSTSTGE